MLTIKGVGEALITKNGYSGEYAPAFSKKLHPCSVQSKSITPLKRF